MKNFFYLDLSEPIKEITDVKMTFVPFKGSYNFIESTCCSKIIPEKEFDRLVMIFDMQKKGLYEHLLKDEIQLPKDLFERHKHG